MNFSFIKTIDIFKKLSLYTTVSLTTSLAIYIPSMAQSHLFTNISDALAYEHQTTLPDSPFYTSPLSVQNNQTWPGAVIRIERANNYTLPDGIIAWRILYHSLDAEKQDVISSAVVLLPTGTQPSGGWPLVAWAHGTSGVAQSCAPSRMKNLYYGNEGLFEFPKSGLAVVATDYHGLGTSGAHQYMNKLAQAYDVIYAVAAAQSAFPQLAKDWVSDGHSQGGMASWSVAELEKEAKNKHYLGTVSVSGTINMLDFIDPLPKEKGAPFYFPMVAFGLQARYPTFDVHTALTPAGYEHYPLIASSGCWYAGYAAYSSQTSSQIMQPGWTNLPVVRRMLAENEIGTSPVQGPMMVLTGGGDTSVPPEGVRKTAVKSCKNGVSLFFHLYPGLDHDPTMTQSVQDQINWIKDRFAHKPFVGNCGAF
ncbi:lipase [Acetobacter syzygii]|uniref:lipase family protein n=1 Tax=Acetobacter syzygii TaxID=146476 RepID=UPI0005E34EFB|nr:lipase family protein [Acetobacter syzygii]GAN72022.1 hypothetical protein Absy_027_120 [Acetobacter syzygii]GBR64287.1 secretory lipase [Acetobacter syzygii NRIC 0483]GEL55288.1 lipase [Acetobacter syzygii]